MKANNIYMAKPLGGCCGDRAIGANSSDPNKMLQILIRLTYFRVHILERSVAAQKTLDAYFVQVLQATTFSLINLFFFQHV